MTRIGGRSIFFDNNIEVWLFDVFEGLSANAKPEVLNKNPMQKADIIIDGMG